MGLWLFRGFTTRTSRAQNYAVVLYGLDIAEKAVHKYGYAGDDATRTQLFERWERFWALATIEFHKGQLPRGHEDAMRGVRGAVREWFPGNKPLPLDFPLISRQNELGGLGAYLTSLREYSLVFPGTLRVTPAARGILDAFWSEQGKGDRSQLYEDYALAALDFNVSKVRRDSGGLTFKTLGARSRLSSLVHRARVQQQERLWNALFVAARDGSTLPLAEQVMAAHDDGVAGAEDILEGMINGRWGELDDANVRRVEVALAFGRIARILLQRFDNAYGYVDKEGWVADINAVAAASFPSTEARELKQSCKLLLSARESARFGKLQYHGPEFLTLLTKLSTSGSVDSLEHMLAYHRVVQRVRRGGGAWLRPDQTKLVMQMTSYSGYQTEVDFPDMKLSVVRSLLADLGRLE